MAVCDVDYVGSGRGLFVCDERNHRVQVFDADLSGAEQGQLPALVFGREGTAPGEFRKPTAITACRGRLVVGEFSGRRLQVLSVLGEPLQLISRLNPSDGKSVRIGPFCVDDDEQHGRGVLFAAASAPAAPLHRFELLRAR